MVPSTHTVLPVLQSVRPSLQGPEGLPVQAMLGTQAPQFPLASQTWPAPHIVPAALLLPSTQVWEPVAHEVMPLRQPGLGLVVQGAAAMQLMQLPLLEQTWLVPQLVPAARLPESMHVWAPVAHEVTPVLHPGFGLVVQDAPATQARQLPMPLQTRSGPQPAPAATFAPSTQRVTPVEQSMEPLLHGAPGLLVQVAPCTHMPQKPLASHTCPEPQFVPAARGGPSTQVSAPVAHEVTPVRQPGFGLVAQAFPARQLTQVPAGEQTRSAPQLDPAGFNASLAHTG